MTKKKKEEPAPPTVRGRLKSFFSRRAVLRNSDVQEICKVGHKEAGRIIRYYEARDMLQRTKTTKQAAFYGPGPQLWTQDQLKRRKGTA